MKTNLRICKEKLIKIKKDKISLNNLIDKWATLSNSYGELN
jgi:hypothetical protein